MGYIGKKPTDKPLTSADLADNIVTSAKIVDGTIADADINDVAGSKLTGTVADARISTLTASKLTGALPAISGANLTGITTDMTPIRQDINTLALHSAISDNKAAYNLTDSFIDQFEDDTGIGSEVTCDRQADDEYVSSITLTTEPNTLALWTFPDATTTVGDSTGVEYIDDLGNLKIVENGDLGQECTTDGKFNGYRAIQTAGWGGGSANYGFQIELVAGKTHPIDFGTGPFTIELFSKNVNSSQPSQYETLWEINDGTNTFSTPKAWYSGQATSYLDGTVIPGNYPYCADWMHNALHVTSWVHSAYCRDANGNHSFWINGGHNGNYGTGSALAPNSGTAYRDYSRTTTYLRDQDFTGASAYIHLGVNGGKIRGQFADYSMIRFSDIARYDPTQTSITVPTAAFVGQSGVSNAAGTVTGIANVPTTTNQTEVSGVMLYKDNAGVGTIGGGSYDLKIEFTCDGGSNWTEAAGYTAVTPLFSTGVKMVKLAKTTCTAGNDVRYRASFANQVSGSKETQLHGIAINY
jgi:hypothetical protein